MDHIKRGQKCVRERERYIEGERDRGEYSYREGDRETGRERQAERVTHIP
jgi:hypothetical protein